jgi:hypothetical protein
MYYEPKHFTLAELVPPEVKAELGDQAILLLEPRMLMMIDGIRQFFGKPITINNWQSNGQFKLRGFRPPDTATGAKWSQHKFGRAADMDIQGFTAEQARQTILANQNNPDLSYISVMEAGVAWVHADCRNIKSNAGIVMVNP